MTTEPPKYAPMPTAPPKSPEAIRVGALRFGRQGNGQGVSLGAPFPADPIILAAGKRRGGGAAADEIQIQYEPWHRMYRARALNNGAVIGERCIPESWAIYEPLVD